MPLLALLALLAGCSRNEAGSSAAAMAPPLRQVRLAVVQPGSGCQADGPGWPAGARPGEFGIWDFLETLKFRRFWTVFLNTRPLSGGI